MYIISVLPDYEYKSQHIDIIGIKFSSIWFNFDFMIKEHIMDQYFYLLS